MTDQRARRLLPMTLGSTPYEQQQENPMKSAGSPAGCRQRRSKRVLHAAAALTSATIIALVSAGTADASVLLKEGADWAQAATSAQTSNDLVRAYDGERDGNGVYADFYLTGGQHGSMWDGNGADGEPGPWMDTGGQIDRFRVCEDHGDCSDWWYRNRS